MKPTSVIPVSADSDDVGVAALSAITGETMGDPDLIVSTVQQVENLSKVAAYRQAEALVELRGFGAFYLGGILRLAQDQGWYKEDGYQSFGKFVDERFGIARSTAYDYMKIYSNLLDSGVEWASVEHLGWTKLREFAAHLTKENKDDWVKIAEGMNTGQLREYVRSLSKGAVVTVPVSMPKLKVSARADNEENDDTGSVVDTSPQLVSVDHSKTCKKTFYLHADQQETVESALKACKKEGNTEHDAVALEYICIHYLESKLGMK